ncbi:DUF3152 domain-containing protein [Streptomyces flaveus]|uniref:DUF3152 domain-containing protein n=1 Tax=Streptomyces flaveus TaxID=66370 RepID=A0A917VA29_9ACTN|nr:DUF3152 domain-containing protein [Streptomyces flaveus]GGK53400.1 hypothetical protein GCM10010094_12260 [Streptomyces flaveus]
MGRHSRRGSARKGDTAEVPVVPGGRPEPSTGQRRVPSGPQPQPQPPPRGGGPGTPAGGIPRLPEGWVPRPDANGVPRFPDGTPAGGVPRYADGTPARGVPRLPDGTPARGVPRVSDGTPAHGVPRLPDGTPAHGVPRYADGTPAHGVPGVRGAHPEQREPGGGWGMFSGAPGYGAPQGSYPGVSQGAGPGHTVPRQRQAQQPGPRQAYVDAFGKGDDVFEPHSADQALRSGPYYSATDWDPDPAETEHKAPPAPDLPEKAKGGKGWTFTGIAAAAVTTVLAVVVAGQVTEGREDTSASPQASSGADREVKGSAARGDTRPTPPSEVEGAAPPTYNQLMAKKYPLDANLKADGEFEAIRGFDQAPGTGQKFTYRVDVEKGLGLDGGLFAQAVHKTLNDDRSWAHDGGRTFERVSTGRPDFVITLASPGTTAFWCAKSGLDTTVDNVSCDSAATERVMINAYRWAQGAKTYGDKMYAYRQMLINHEIGHRLGYGHVTCDKNGELAPVMQQQSKFLEYDGIKCRANPWPFPGA